MASEPLCVKDRDGIWHAHKGRGNADYQPIRCGMGINLPGPSEPRQPTCDACNGGASDGP